jgi:hypothetical protein
MGPKAPCRNKRKVDSPITVRLPDGSTIHSTHVANLNLPHLPPEATETHIFPSLGDTHLLSIGKLCDADCTCIFSKKQATIKRHGETILQGTRSEIEPRLWTINLPEAQETMYAAIAVNQSTKPADMVAFSHATLFSPPLTTLAAALRKNFLIGFPGLTKETLAKYPPHSMATIKGHLDQSRVKRKGARSIKSEPPPNPSDPETIIEPNPNEDSETDYHPSSDTPNIRTNYCYAAIIASLHQPNRTFPHSLQQRT